MYWPVGWYQAAQDLCPQRPRLDRLQPPRQPRSDQPWRLLAYSACFRHTVVVPRCNGLSYAFARKFVVVFFFFLWLFLLGSPNPVIFKSVKIKT
jgi:hypothetical protein